MILCTTTETQTRKGWYQVCFPKQELAMIHCDLDRDNGGLLFIMGERRIICPQQKETVIIIGKDKIVLPCSHITRKVCVSVLNMYLALTLWGRFKRGVCFKFKYFAENWWVSSGSI